MLRDGVYKALADPTRRTILRLLSRNGELPAGSIGENFLISAPSLSHHFNILKEADLVRARRDGQQILYSLNTTALQDLMVVLLDLMPEAPSSPGAAGETNR
jgi:DNA-binding transcriptional ArsR family regulator